MNELVSIIVPAYNCQNYINKCVNSILNQTYDRLELIIIDDGSTDGTASFCDELKLRDDRIKIIHKNNGGASSARNIGIKRSKGEFILFIDADDEIEIDYIESLMLKNSYDLVICGYKDVYTQENREKINLLNTKEYQNLSGNIYVDLDKMHNFIVYPYIKLYKRSIIIEKGIFFPENLCVGEDQIFNFEYLRYINNYCFINEAKYSYYHRCNNSLSEKIDRHTFDSEFKWFKRKVFYLNNAPIDMEVKGKITGDDLVYFLNKYICYFSTISSYMSFIDLTLESVNYKLFGSTFKRRLMFKCSDIFVKVFFAFRYLNYYRGK